MVIRNGDDDNNYNINIQFCMNFYYVLFSFEIIFCLSTAQSSSQRIPRSNARPIFSK